MRTLALALLLPSAALLALAPLASAAPSTCQISPEPDETYDQTYYLVCLGADWLLWGGTSPVVTARAYAACYTHQQPPASWYPACT